jgi:hypothetical protein
MKNHLIAMFALVFPRHITLSWKQTAAPASCLRAVEVNMSTRHFLKRVQMYNIYLIDFDDQQLLIIVMRLVKPAINNTYNPMIMLKFL